MTPFDLIKKTVVLFALIACNDTPIMRSDQTKSTQAKDSTPIPSITPPLSQNLKVTAYLIYKDGSISDFDILNDKSVALWNTVSGGGDAIKPSNKVKLILNGYVEGLLVKIKTGRKPVIEKRLSNFVGEIEIIIEDTGCEEVTIGVFGHQKILFSGTIPFHCGE